MNEFRLKFKIFLEQLKSKDIRELKEKKRCHVFGVKYTYRQKQFNPIRDDSLILSPIRRGAGQSICTCTQNNVKFQMELSASSRKSKI